MADEVDYLEEAKDHYSNGDPVSAAAAAQIAQTEQLKRLGDLFDGTTNAPGLIGVTGHVTTGSP